MCVECCFLAQQCPCSHWQCGCSCTDKEMFRKARDRKQQRTSLFLQQPTPLPPLGPPVLLADDTQVSRHRCWWFEGLRVIKGPGDNSGKLMHHQQMLVETEAGGRKASGKGSDQK